MATNLEKLEAAIKTAGLEKVFEGKSVEEKIKLWTEYNESIIGTLKSETGKEFIENVKTKLPEFVKALSNPFEIYVKPKLKEGKPGRFAKHVPVIGYIAATKEKPATYIVSTGANTRNIKEGEIINSPYAKARDCVFSQSF
jgi:hypothetical protein